LALGELHDGRWRQEPGNEGVLSHSGAGEGEEFEETAGAEEIEVGSVETGVDVAAREGLIYGGVAGVKPAILDAGESFAVEVCGALGTGVLAKNFCMEDGDCEKHYGSEQQPPYGESIAVEREPSSDQCYYDDKKAQISEAAVKFFEVCDLSFAGLLALLVLL
jgi:hypothetical protein